MPRVELSITHVLGLEADSDVIHVFLYIFVASVDRKKAEYVLPKQSKI